MKCFFCKGSLDRGICIMCGRSNDIKHELKVKEAQKKSHTNIHFYGKASGMHLRVHGDKENAPT